MCRCTKWRDNIKPGNELKIHTSALKYCNYIAAHLGGRVGVGWGEGGGAVCSLLYWHECLLVVLACEKAYMYALCVSGSVNTQGFSWKCSCAAYTFSFIQVTVSVR